VGRDRMVRQRLPESVSQSESIGGESKLAFLFGLGHGHATQFVNFQECFPEDQRARAEWIGLAMDQSGDWVSRLPFVPWQLRARRNQLWHARAGLARHDYWDAVFLAAGLLGLMPVIRSYPTYVYTDLTPSLMRQYAPWYDATFYRMPGVESLRQRLFGALYRSCRGIFSMSAWAAAGMRRDYGVPPERIHVSLPGANLRRWHFVDRTDRHGSVRILMVGGQFNLKGGPLLLDWASNTAATGWELDIVTWPGELPLWIDSRLPKEPREGQFSIDLAPKLPNVRLHFGLRANNSDLMNLYRDADIFCLPTRADGSSIASLEAMATGLPVLVSAVGGIPELVEDGQTAILLKPNDPSDLRSKLDALIADEPRRLILGRAARHACEMYYNVERQVREILQVIDRDRSQPIL